MMQHFGYAIDRRYFNQAERGGHFAAWEQPQLFSEELRAAFAHCGEVRLQAKPNRERPRRSLSRA
jgi:hypothetical protein